MSFLYIFAVNIVKTIRFIIHLLLFIINHFCKNMSEVKKQKPEQLSEQETEGKPKMQLNFIAMGTTFWGDNTNFMLAGSGTAAIHIHKDTPQKLVKLKALPKDELLLYTTNKWVVELACDPQEPKVIVIMGRITGLLTGETKETVFISTEFMPSLRYLNCAAENISKLDVTKNLELEELVCSSNHITTLDLSKNTALRKLRVDINKMSRSALAAMFAGLTKCPQNDKGKIIFRNNPGADSLTSYDLNLLKARNWEIYVPKPGAM